MTAWFWKWLSGCPPRLSKSMIVQSKEQELWLWTGMPISWAEPYSNAVDGQQTVKFVRIGFFSDHESRNSYVHEEEQCRRSKTKSNNVVYTKPVNIYFLVVWLATQARDILWYLLVCKTQWTSTSNHPFQLNFDQIKLLFLSLVIHWFGIYTKTIIPRDLPS